MRTGRTIVLHLIRPTCTVTELDEYWAVVWPWPDNRVRDGPKSHVLLLLEKPL